MKKIKMMKRSELEIIADAQYRKALVRYIKITMGEAVDDGESILQLYTRSITWYNSQFEDVQTNSSNPPPPPPPPPHG